MLKAHCGETIGSQWTVKVMSQLFTIMLCLSSTRHKNMNKHETPDHEEGFYEEGKIVLFISSSVLLAYIMQTLNVWRQANSRLCLHCLCDPHPGFTLIQQLVSNAGGLWQKIDFICFDALGKLITSSKIWPCFEYFCSDKPRYASISIYIRFIPGSLWPLKRLLFVWLGFVSSGARICGTRVAHYGTRVFYLTTVFSKRFSGRFHTCTDWSGLSSLVQTKTLVV